jgi:RHS repeat-associated protein
MGTVCYTVVNGQVMSENRDGVERDYLSDSLGNTLALVDSTGTKTDTFSYFPSGKVASRTGTTPTPFQWAGGHGYYRDNSTRTHVRARNFYVNLGRWSTQDPMGFAGGDYNLYRMIPILGVM